MARHPAGSINYAGQNLLDLSEKTIRHIRGNRIAMIFQEPMTSLNPLHSIEKQINEVLGIHKGLSGKVATKRTLELLEMVGIPEPHKRLKALPHELSGGQRQRVMIAMALANEPELLIADEPTTALDVTVQLKILDLLKDLQARLGMSLLLISHDLNLVRRIAHRVCVMQRGCIVEQASCAELFRSPQHPYTRELLGAEPAAARRAMKSARRCSKSRTSKSGSRSRKACSNARWITSRQWTASISACLRARPWGSSAKAVPANPPSVWRFCG